VKSYKTLLLQSVRQFSYIIENIGGLVNPAQKFSARTYPVAGRDDPARPATWGREILDHCGVLEFGSWVLALREQRRVIVALQLHKYFFAFPRKLCYNPAI